MPYGHGPDQLHTERIAPPPSSPAMVPLRPSLSSAWGLPGSPNGSSGAPKPPPSIADVTPANGDGTAQNDVTQKKVITRPNPLPFSSLKTGLCYDVRMRFHATVDPEDMHPEDPRRIFEIYKLMVQAGLVDDPNVTGIKKVDDMMLRIQAREVEKEEALLVHDEAHWDFLERTTGLKLDELQDLTLEGDSVYFNSESFFCARLSCGGAIETCKAVMKGLVKNAIAVVRPPGHHAEPHKAMGFCLFNNVSVATRCVQKAFPECKKVLILDWDVHHGNGTQTAFYDDPSVLYMSIHRYQNGKFYPEGPQGNLDMCGEGEGLGMNVNVPWSTGGMGDGDYMYAFQRVIMPIALEFNPDLVIVSAGFDAAAGDALGGCFVTPAGYAHMTHMLMSLANGKLVVCLEGGYNLQSISNSALAVTKVLMGEPPGKLHDGNVASRSAVEVVQRCVIQQSRYWRCMRPRGIIMDFPDTPELKADRLHDIIRSYQTSRLYDRHRMTRLSIFRERISKSFENQVVGTPDYFTKETVLFIVHDPPPVTASPDPQSNKISLHNAFLLDAVNLYIDWAINCGYGVIDANIPQALTGDGHGDYDVIRQTEELCIYMWDNYLEISDAKNFIFVGVGEAFVGLTHLLGHRDCRDRVRACLSFVGDNNLRAVSANIADEYLPEWYYNHSRVFVSKEHAVWEKKTKHKKKFGRLVQSTATDLHDILRRSRDDATAWMEEKIGPARIVPAP